MQPYIPAEKQLPELTVRSIVLGVALSVILAAANAYLGLFAGMTVSASIPAAVISMGIFRLLRSSSILENNIVQTAASAGEALAAGAIFTLPALVLMGVWQTFDYWEVLAIVLSGGLLGVLFTIPLRRMLIVEQQLVFPEGIATAEVLKVGERGGRSIRFLLRGAVVGAILKFVISGMKVLAEVVEFAATLFGKWFFYFGANVSPALLAVGFIVRLRIALLVFLGGVLSWWIAIPVLLLDAPTADVAVAYQLWSSQIRYLGVGAMLVGGVWSIWQLRRAMVQAVRRGIQTFRQMGQKMESVVRTELDTPLSWVLLGIGILTVPIFVLYYFYLQQLPLTFAMTILLLIAGFLFSTVAGYMAGLVGSSNNPISGITIATVLTTALLLLLLGGTSGDSGAATAILVGAVVCTAAAIGGDNMQDLKAGYVLGATPWKQQIAQVVGVGAAAVVIAPVLNLLLVAYGFGEPTPAHPHPLAAPQAVLMSSVATGVFGANLPWNMIGWGVALGVAIILWDQWLQRRGSSWRIPVLAVAVGTYLPLELDMTIFLGGVLAAIVERSAKAQREQWLQRGLLVASGLITGEALIGIILALPIAATGDPSVFQWLPIALPPWSGAIVLLAVAGWFYRSVKAAP